MNRFCKAMSHLNSTQIDEKIKFLDKQLKKTGIVLEAGPTMGTGNIYQTFRYDFTPELPEIEGYVPDSTGFTTGDSTQDANDGDESDSDTWENGWNNTNDMKNSNNLNGETNRIIPYTPDFSGWDGSGVSANNRGSGGYAGIGIWTISSGLGGGKSIGTIDSTNHFIQILVPDNIFSSYNYPADQSGPASGGYYGSYTDSEFAVARSVAETYENHKTTSLFVTRKVWVNFDQATAPGEPSFPDSTLVKKQTTNPSNGQPLFWTLKSVSVLAGARQSFTSKDAVDTPSEYITLTRNSIDDANFYPGNPDKFMDFLRGALDVGEKAFDYLADKAGEVRDTVQDILDQFMNELEGNESNLPPKVKDFIQDTKDSSLTQSIIDNVLEPFREKMAEKRIIPAAQNIVNYLTDNLPDTLDNDYLNSLEDGYVDKVIASGKIQDDGTFYAGENIVGTAQAPREDGDYVEIDFNMGFKDNITDFADRAADPLYGEVNPVMQAIYDFLGPYSFDAQTSTGAPLIDMAAGYIFSDLIEKAKRYGGAQDKPGTLRISKENLKKVNSLMHYMLVQDGTITEGLSLPESKDFNTTWSKAFDDPKHVNVDTNQAKRWFKSKDVKPVYPQKAPPKMVNGRHPKLALPELKTAVPQIKVTKKDLLKNHFLKKDEVDEMINLVNNLNKYIKENPNQLAYARQRYPMYDVRLAELNFRLDRQLEAADEYIEKQFPENQKLFDKIKAITKKSIELTDPKTYENKNGDLMTFNKLARVESINGKYESRSLKLKKSNKKSASRFFFKPKEKTRDEILNDKMSILDKEMKKTMPDV